MLIEVKNLTFSYTGVPILKNASFALHEGERVGLIGGNGEGKSTLLKLLVGELTPEAGSVTRRSSLSLGYLEQGADFSSEETAYAVLEKVFEEDKRLLASLAETQSAMAGAGEQEMRVLAARAESLAKRVVARDSYNFGVKIKTVLNGMGFEGMYGQVVSTMSGGEKTRLKLCRLLLEEPELLVLDEPTNHLDLKTLFWLEDYLISYKGALLAVSHDRYFLDRLTSRTVEVERGKVTSYKGSYSKYRVLKEEKFKEETRAYERQQEEIRKLQTYVDKNIVRATTASSALSRANKLERMELLERPLPPPPPPRFRFTYDERPYETVVKTSPFTLTAGGKVLLEKETFTLMRGKRCAIVGDNGTGKSTLLRFLLSGAPEVSLGRFVRVAYYDQENADLPKEERTLDAFWGRFPRLTQTEARSLLARAGLNAEDVQKRVGELSGGLRAKLGLAALEGRHGNFLVLDEPTNHLDLPARESLEEALKAFDGTLLFVSHDRRFIETLADTVCALENGKLVWFEGKYGDYLNARRAQPAAVKAKKAEAPRKEERAREAQRRNRISEIERKLAALEGEAEALEKELAEKAGNYLEVRRISARQEEVREEIDALYEEYGELI